jgi:hypothetical protein
LRRETADPKEGPMERLDNMHGTLPKAADDGDNL